MTPSKQSLSELSTLAKDLNKATDGLNDLFLALEKKLAAMQIGVTVWCSEDADDLLDSSAPYPDFDTQEGKFVQGYQLGYTKIGEEWRIAVRFATVEEDHDEHSNIPYWKLKQANSVAHPVVQASRIVRVEAAGQLDMLIACLKGQAKSYLKDIEKAKEHLK